ncbi:hypothetical protein Ae201684_009277 [Aphanomyces euteiches]|uniref:Uncharacterized protein n=1 Tax=Aphanomyces euteiches TaxID=100861 RepID=A0A6G0X1N2_9STRA|nr:hypothetical protein Ae201684_009277 [Aphanomyces euteiches]
MRDISMATEISIGTLSRHLKKGTLRRRSSRIKPLLSDAKAGTCQFDHKPSNSTIYGTRKVYLVPGEEPSCRSWKSKRFIPKVMFLATLRREPWCTVRWQGGHVAHRLQGPSGTLVQESSSGCYDYVINKVVPAIKASFPSTNKRVILQQDNATPHRSVTDAELELVSTDGWTFVVRRQPPNSPDLNVLDLGFFASIQSLQLKKVSRTVDELERVFLTFQAVMRLVLEHDGDNKFALPHLKTAALRYAGLLMDNVSCPVSLLM